MRSVIVRVVLASASLAAALAAPAAPAAPAPLPRDSVYQLEAPLTDQSGRHLKLAAKRGRPQLVVMFYTSCKYICPTIIDTVLDLDHKLTPVEQARLGVLLISLDPQRDDPTALKATADKRGLDLARWTLVQPQPADVRAIAGVLGVRYRALDDGELNHTGVLVLLDADGRIVAKSSKTSGAVDPQFMARVRAALAKS
ncbi:MAG TPA: SCO family protein [Rubrivivax sp.]